MSKAAAVRTIIPKVVLDSLAGAAIYPQSAYFSENPAEICARAIEDAEYLLVVWSQR